MCGLTAAAAGRVCCRRGRLRGSPSLQTSIWKAATSTGVRGGVVTRVCVCVFTHAHACMCRQANQPRHRPQERVCTCACVHVLSSKPLHRTRRMRARKLLPCSAGACVCACVCVCVLTVPCVRTCATGWFQSSLLTAVAATGSAPYKQVCVTGGAAGMVPGTPCRQRQNTQCSPC
jgi:hypothetical protein